jgi:hypothetical protein
MKKITLTILLSIAAIFLFSQVGLSTSKTNTKQATNNPRSFYLPFFEDWSSGSLETNNWQAETENWKINNQEGNERPSVEFDWSPLLEDDYSCSLESDQFNGEFYKVGMVFLEYDLKLFDRNSTGAEKLSIEVFDGDNWNQVAEYSNDGSFDWEYNTVEITEFALNKNFKIRFNATGQDSYDIFSWYVDNISVYRECDPPFDLDGQVYWHEQDDKGAEIWWAAPESTVVDMFEWLHWDHGNNDPGLGITGPGDFTAAARWTDAQIESYQGDTINAVRFYIADSGFAEIVLNIWTGDEGVNLVYQKPISEPAVDEWNALVLDSILIIENTDYWIGVSVIGQPVGFKPIGLDVGPAVSSANYVSDGSGNWYALDDLGINRNLNIQMELKNGDTVSKGCIGFNVYRQDNSSPDYNFIGFVDFIENKSEYEYLDADVGWNTMACYKVNALWGLNGDTCLSAYALQVIPITDEICVFLFDGVNETYQNSLTCYPNPASEFIEVESAIKIYQTAIINLQGQLLFTEQFYGREGVKLDVSFLKPGLYILKVNTEKGVITKKFLKTE